ncbi:MAG: Ni/Fe hydrogenase subunit alpha [Xanthomonadales bacterium]|nr:Ni/Fe hydrogenase subunit alpha [Gammaproteobacteria bacterium]MBT8053747.1 Ni/Fe hydrogenase subunit alpha [Gammaproteobacteria bacterium]NND57642.1 Ni/Fe hydrogenase subunit alpha [Xanthomonadales bacterium]NNK51584.1 Ni/Fe hydrogenase subunit alpha [Xanthomonadales bacterium]
MSATRRKIMIDPVTRVEGHGRVTVQLDEAGNVDQARFHVVEFRGFERFIQGHPYWEAPLLVQRLCGICPVSHHLAAAKAVDQIYGVDPRDLHPTATMIRRLLHYAQLFQSHALHFFYLASPDLLFGMEAPVEKRSVGAVAMEHGDLARKGIQMRQFGQELIKALAGKKIHGITAVPGGIHKTFYPEERDYFLSDNVTPSVDTMIQWSQEVVTFIKDYHDKNFMWLDSFASYPSGHLGLVGTDGALELYDGRMRAIDSRGEVTLNDVDNDSYLKYFGEGVEKWSYMKFPFLRHLGRQHGWNRVGPLARLNVCDSISTPLANAELREFKAYTNGRPNNHTMHSHWARLIEILHCAEQIRNLLNEPRLLEEVERPPVSRRPEGIGIIEAPRGTLIHHYKADEKGSITKCNLIVSTTHNNEPMNRAVRWVAKNVLDQQKAITDGMLNQVEVAIRAYDPCLSCATHAMGQMPLKLTVFDADGAVVAEHVKHPV